MRQVLAAASDWRTLIWLGVGVVAGAVLSNPFPAVIGLGVYLWAVQRMAASPAFQAAGERARMARAMAGRFQVLQEQARAVVRALPAGGGRVNQVMDFARQIYQEWSARPDVQAEKGRFVEEALRLADFYLRILRAYHAIYSDRGPAVDRGAIEARLLRNQRRLEETVDLEARRALAQAIELDQRVLEQEEEDEVERERYQAKMTAIESALDLLRRQLYDPDSGGESSRLQDMLVEAEALDEALQEVEHRTRVRVR